jgi:hypothetical protein
MLLVISCKSDTLIKKVKSEFEDKTFPIQLDADGVYLFDTVHVAFQNIRIILGRGQMIPLESEAGITGLIVFSEGTLFHYNNTLIERSVEEVGDFVFIRFNPNDLKFIINLDSLEMESDREIYKRAWSVIDLYFKHSYSKGFEAEIPKEGSYSVIMPDKKIDFDATSGFNLIESIER